MKAVREWDESDLDRVVAADQKETTTLDYKDSAALDEVGALRHALAQPSFCFRRTAKILPCTHYVPNARGML